MAEAEAQANGSAPAEPNWQQFIDGINKLNENFSDFRQESRAAAQPVEEEEVEEQPTQEAQLPAVPDFDQMSQKEVAHWLMNHFGTTVVGQIIERVQAAIAPLQQQQQANQQATLEERYTREITQLIEEKKPDGKPVRPDFQDWNTQMIEIVRELPGIQPADAYNMARARDPSRAKDLDAKYNPPPPPPKSPFSFAPGSGGGASAPPAKPVSRDDAFRNAMAKVKEKWGDSFALGQKEF